MYQESTQSWKILIALFSKGWTLHPAACREGGSQDGRENQPCCLLFRPSGQKMLVGGSTGPQPFCSKASLIQILECAQGYWDMMHPMDWYWTKFNSTTTVDCTAEFCKISVEGVCRKKEERSKCIKGEGKKRRWRKWGFTWGGIWLPHKRSQLFAHVLTLIGASIMSLCVPNQITI